MGSDLHRIGQVGRAGDVLPLAVIVAAYVLVMITHALLSRMPGPVWDDIAEAWSWGQQLQLGYYKHPPFYAWVARVWFDAFGRSDISAYALAATTGAVGLVGIWRLAGRLLYSNSRVLAVLLVIMTPHHTVMATNFNANTILLALWPWTAFAFLRTFETRSARHAILLGLLSAACLLSKYISILLLTTFIVVALVHVERWPFFRSPAPYIAALTCLIAFSPHLWWLATQGGPSIDYAMARTGRPMVQRLVKALTTDLALCALLLPMIGTLYFSIGWTAFKQACVSAVRALPQRRFIPAFALAFGTILLAQVSGFVGVKLQTNYLIPTIFALPLGLLAASALPVTDHAVRRAAVVAACWGVLLVLASPGMAALLLKRDVKYAIDPSREVALAATAMWHERMGRPVRLVSGTEIYSLGLVFYSPDRPTEFTHFNFGHAPWVTRQRIDAEGLLAVCLSEDVACKTSAASFGRAGMLTERMTRRNQLFGISGPEREFDVIMIPPQR